MPSSLLTYMLLVAARARQSEFNKPIDYDALDKAYREDLQEDDDWHEDTMDWKEKMHAKRMPKFDLEKFKKGPVEFDPLEFSKGGMKISFVTLKDEWCDRPAKCRGEGKSSSASCCTAKDAWNLGSRWVNMLKTGAIDLKATATAGTKMMLIDHDSHVKDIKDFVMEQPEVLSYKVDNVDYYTDGMDKGVEKEYVAELRAETDRRQKEAKRKRVEKLKQETLAAGKPWPPPGTKRKGKKKFKKRKGKKKGKKKQKKPGSKATIEL